MDGNQFEFTYETINQTILHAYIECPNVAIFWLTIEKRISYMHNKVHKVDLFMIMPRCSGNW